MLYLTTSGQYAESGGFKCDGCGKIGGSLLPGPGLLQYLSVLDMCLVVIVGSLILILASPPVCPPVYLDV